MLKIAEPQATTSGTAKCFLIHDGADDQGIFTLAVQELDSSIRCHFSHDGTKAVETPCNDSFFLNCLLDINSTRMNGIECLEKIGGIKRFEMIPASVVEKTNALGENDFIIKPASISAPTSRLLQFLNSIVRLQ